MKQGYTKSWRKKYDSKTAKRGLLYVGAMTWMLEHAAEDGQVTFTYRGIANEWKLSLQNARTIIAHLISDNFLVVIKTTAGHYGKTSVKIIPNTLTNTLSNTLKKVANNCNSISCDAEKLVPNTLTNTLSNTLPPENAEQKKKNQKENIRNVVYNNNLIINTKKNSKEKSICDNTEIEPCKTDRRGVSVENNFYPNQETGIAPLEEMTQADKGRVIREIINAYPRRISPTITASAIARAISRITDAQGITQQQAADYLLERVKLYARAVKLWDKEELRYITNPAEFFNRDQYLENEDLWFRGRIEIIDEVEYDIPF